MIGLDTDVLVRYLTQDDPAQSRRADAAIAAAAARGEPLHVSSIVLCELVWVLAGSYDIAKAEIVEALERMLATPQLDIEDRDLVRRAVADFKGGPGDLSDYLIGRRNEAQGCTKTLTFDRRLKKHPAFRGLAG